MIEADKKLIAANREDRLIKVIAAVITDFTLLFVFMWAYNYWLSGLFGLPKINYWQALLIRVMVRYLAIKFF